MSDINEVRERLRLGCDPDCRISINEEDVKALMADHARLQSSHDRLLKAAQYLQSWLVKAHGVSRMDEMHAAIDAAKEVQP